MKKDNPHYFLKADSEAESAYYQFDVNEFSDLDANANLEQLTECAAMNFVNITQKQSVECDDSTFLAGNCEFSPVDGGPPEYAFYLYACDGPQSNITPTVKTCFDNLCGDPVAPNALGFVVPVMIAFGTTCILAWMVMGAGAIHKNYFANDTDENEPLMKNTSNSSSCFATLFSKTKAWFGDTNNEYENMETVQNRI